MTPPLKHRSHFAGAVRFDGAEIKRRGCTEIGSGANPLQTRADPCASWRWVRDRSHGFGLLIGSRQRVRPERAIHGKK
jgi:hypothetical protein